MAYAITSNGIGNPVGFRSIKPSWPLEPGEAFKVDALPPNPVLAPDGASLEDGTLWMAKANKKAEIKEAMAAQLAAGYITSVGVKMDATLDDIRRLDFMRRLMQRIGRSSFDVRDHGNVVHKSVTLANVQTMVNEAATHYQTLLGKKWTLEAQVDAAVTVAEVDAIVW